uniref:Uncharacterized protein n=1 Tax=Plectus sambesii TaxID=2011161 RepID=A0A914UJK0_9BILA
MSLSTIRVIFLLLLAAIIGQIVEAQDEPDELTEKMTLWSQFFNRITSVGLENLREHLPGLVPPAEVEGNLTSEATTTPYDRFIIRGGEELPHRAPARKLTGEGASKSRDLNQTTIDDTDIVVNADNTTAVSNATNNFPIDADSNNVTLMKNDVSYGDGNENTTKSPFPLEEHIFREEPRRTLFQQTDPNGTPGTVFNLNANANSNSDPNVSNHFDPSNFLSNLTPLVLPLINTFGTSLNEQHLQLLEDQKRRLALLSAPRSYVPNDGEELPGFGTALYNELVQNRRPSGFGSALANDLARSEQTQNVIQAVKVSPPTAYPLRYRPLARGLPVYPRISVESVSTTVVPLRRNGSPLPRR